MDRYVFSAQLTRLSPVGITPSGLRLDVGFAGTVTDGPLTGCTIEGIDYLLVRPDGVGVVDACEFISSESGPATSVRARGYVVPPFAMPELPVLADPSFSWPDAELPLHGSSFVETADPSVDVANRTVYGWTGAVNIARGTLEIDARSLAVMVSA